MSGSFYPRVELGLHPTGGLPRVGEVTHMCPKCGFPPAPFCPLCLGAGEVTTQRLEHYQVATTYEALAAGRGA